MRVNATRPVTPEASENSLPTLSLALALARGDREKSSPISDEHNTIISRALAIILPSPVGKNRVESKSNRPRFLDPNLRPKSLDIHHFPTA